MEDTQNTSGMGKNSVLPAELKGWNWGAFLLHWIWGIGNGTYIAFLTFVPFVGTVMCFVLGAKGNEWAWQNKRWQSIEHFRAVQRKWAIWAVVAIAGIFAFLVLMFFLFTGLMKKTPAYQMAMAQVESSEQVVEHIGKPITPGIAMGQIETSGMDGHARLSFSIKGPKGEGMVYVLATEEMGVWKLDQLIFKPEGNEPRIPLISQERE